MLNEFGRQKPLYTFSSMNPYKILGIAQTATEKQIKKAFFVKVKEVHPDIVGKGRESDFIQLSKAYKILSDKSSRRQYDAGPAYPFENSDAKTWSTTGNQNNETIFRQSEYDIRYARYRATGEGENEKRFPTWQILCSIAGVVGISLIASLSFFQARHQKLLVEIEAMHNAATLLEQAAKSKAIKVSEIQIPKAAEQHSKVQE